MTFSRRFRIGLRQLPGLHRQRQQVRRLDEIFGADRMHVAHALQPLHQAQHLVAAQAAVAQQHLAQARRVHAALVEPGLEPLQSCRSAPCSEASCPASDRCGPLRLSTPVRTSSFQQQREDGAGGLVAHGTLQLLLRQPGAVGLLLVMRALRAATASP
ncbi:MAG: hypothetical protein IPM99_27795 [Rubrivivax sp.]|nr:hypothetical protein [Rubrivivax sp.]